MDLKGRVALVTGGARRLGRVVARALGGAGCDLAIHYNASAEEAEGAVSEFRRLGVRAQAYQADLTDLDQITRLFGELEADFGRVDVLVNNAAVFQRKPFLEITPDDWEAVLNLNLRAAFFCSQQAARLMLPMDAGRIINIADLAALQAWPGYAHHCISKAGMVAMTRVLARALAPTVHVNAIAPGPVLPPDELSEPEREELAARTALGRLGAPEDVAHTVLFLATSEYITGATIVVDGGKDLLT